MKQTVSICIPAYNAAPYLRQCLESALAQTFGDFEIILVDNASTDDTFAIANEYAHIDSRIRLYKNPRNLGFLRNFNRCLDLAGGEWLKFLCTDDWFQPTCIERFLAATRPGVLVMTCLENYAFEENIEDAERELHLNYRDDHCFRLSRRFPAQELVSADEFSELMAEDPTYHSMSLNSAMMHRTAVERFGRFNLDLLDLNDWELFARVATHTGLINVADSLTTFRVHSSSAGNDTSMRRPFMMEVISPLIIRHEVAYAPHYAPVRVAAERRKINLHHQLFDCAREARRLVLKYAQHLNYPDPYALADWDETVRRYPRLLSIPADYYLATNWQRGKRVLGRVSARFASRFVPGQS
jgi:glycosyltransferase involved in cell wall biosynthesis